MSFIVEAFFSGCISKVVNDGTDFSIPRIKSALNDKKNRNLPTKVYRVIERALNIVTDKKYKGTDISYDAIERIFIEFRENGDTLESVKCGLGLLVSDVSDQKCENFLDKFYDGVCQDEDLYKRISLILKEKGIKINQQEFQQLNENIEGGFAQLNRKIDEKISINNKNDNKYNLQNRVPVKSRTQEYADKWNENMFLNNFDKRDENAGVNIKLRDVYLDEHLPHYIWGENKNSRNDLKDLLSEYINPHNDNEMLLILGQPGIGKSTLITWSTAKFSERIDDILVYRFAFDFENIDWQNGWISNRVLEKWGLNHSDLNGKILIIDGFDEVSIESNRRRDILDSLYIDWINNKEIKNFSLIITCRENYIQGFERLKCKYITLQTWNEPQIKSFCNIFQEKTKNKVSEDTIEKLFENKEILGIPLILYMVLALNISIEKEGSIVDVYDKIFALEGGIYDRCIDFKSFSEKHRISEIKKYIHQMSREIAFWMFENEPEEAYIPKNEYQRMCDSILLEEECENKNIQQDFLIGNYFKLVKHCEGLEAEELYFVHRSIYEYFVAETIYSSIPNTMKNFSKENLDEFVGIISVYLKKGQITHTICKYLQHKILKLCSARSQEELTFYQWMEMAVDKMVNNGMFYSSEYRNCNNIIYKETKCFINLVEILRQLHDKDNSNYILMNVNKGQIEKYIKYCCITFEKKGENDLNLSKMFLKKVNLVGTNLENINFINAMLEKINLSRANLEKANFSGAILKSANLELAILNNADLSNADLSGAYLHRADLTNAVLREAILNESILIETVLNKANLERANLEKANLRGAILSDANLKEAKLSNVDFSRAILIGADLKDAILSNVILTNAIIDERQAGYLEGKCNLHHTFVLYDDDELIPY